MGAGCRITICSCILSSVLVYLIEIGLLIWVVSRARFLQRYKCGEFEGADRRLGVIAIQWWGLQGAFWQGRNDYDTAAAWIGVVPQRVPLLLLRIALSSAMPGFAYTSILGVFAPEAVFEASGCGWDWPELYTSVMSYSVLEYNEATLLLFVYLYYTIPSVRSCRGRQVPPSARFLSCNPHHSRVWLSRWASPLYGYGPFMSATFSPPAAI